MMRRSFALFCIVLLLAACSLPRGGLQRGEIVPSSNTDEPATFQVVEVTRDSATYLKTWPVTGWSGHYHWFSSDRGPDSSTIQTGDVLKIIIWDNQDNSLLAGNATKLAELPPMSVSSSGKIFMPYLGEVSVRGLTSGQARSRIQDSMVSIAPNAQVQISVTQGRNNSVDLISGVGSPGRYPLETRNTKILSILAQGGGISSTLRHPLVQLQRSGHTYKIRTDDLLREASRNIRLRGGDQISVVEDDRSFNVLGAAQTESVIYFEKEKMTAMEALSLMGGLNDARANPKGILILREYDPKHLAPGTAGPDMAQVVFTIDLTSADGLFAARQFNINPQDTVMPTESPVTAAQTIVGLLGTLIGFGNSVNNL